LAAQAPFGSADHAGWTVRGDLLAEQHWVDDDWGRWRGDAAIGEEEWTDTYILDGDYQFHLAGPCPAGPQHDWLLGSSPACNRCDAPLGYRFKCRACDTLHEETWTHCVCAIVAGGSSTAEAPAGVGELEVLAEKGERCPDGCRLTWEYGPPCAICGDRDPVGGATCPDCGTLWVGGGHSHGFFQAR